MRSQRWWTATSLVLVVVTLASGCASGGKSPEATPEAPEAVEAVEAPEEALAQEAGDEPVQPDVRPEPSPDLIEEPVEEPAGEPEAGQQAEEGSGAYGPKTFVLPATESTSEHQAQTLAEAARQSRERRGEEREPIAVITDQTLSEFATGELTVANQPAATTPPPDEHALGDLQSQEEYWRTQVREARIEWRDLTDEITELEGSVNELRNRFYAEDDGFFRDSQIKPAWDRALDRLAEAKVAVVAAEENLQVVLKEGRQAGALPGWLRDGLEYEPTREEDGQGLGIHEPGEPQVVEDDGGR